MKSWISTAAVAACLVLAPVANAQVSCADVQRTVESARADFEDIIDFAGLIRMLACHERNSTA